MFAVNYKDLTLSFNEFHDLSIDDLPNYGEYCLLELKTGDYTAGEWHPSDSGQTASGKFIRGTADTVGSEEVARWHSLDRYDLTDALSEEGVNWINIGREEEEGFRNVQFEGFKSIADKKNPKEEQFCLLIMKDGSLAAGRWNKWRGEAGGAFIYSSALASHSWDKVWAWTPLSTDEVFAIELERENEKRRERKLNKNPSADPELFKYGMDIDVYYEKALEKLRGEFCWATVQMMKKQTPVWNIAPLHGKYVFCQIGKNYYDDSDVLTPWEGASADGFIDFLCGYTHDTVAHSNPEERFKFGTDVNVYLEKAFNNVKKDYRWLDKKMLAKSWQYDIRRVGGDLEFVRKYWNESEYSVYDVESAERFIQCVEYDYISAALQANKVVASYEPHFGHIEIHGWNLERYVFHRLHSGDFKVSVTAGDRTTGGSRDFFITPYCFEAKTYEEFLDRYLEIVPEHSFGLGKEELLPDKKLREFLGY